MQLVRSLSWIYTHLFTLTILGFGLFRAPARALGIGSATFVDTDTVTQGTWKGTYGANGQAIPNDATNYPSYARVAFSGQIPFSWLTTTTDVRAPQKALASDRIPATWYTSSNFSIDITLTDGNPHQVALYCLDWTSSGRAQRIDMVDG